MAASVLVAVAAAFVSTMIWTHAEGALNFEGWIYRGLGPFQMNKIARSVAYPSDPSGPGLMSAAAGGGTMSFLLGCAAVFCGGRCIRSVTRWA